MPRIYFTPWKEHAELLSVRSQFFPPPSYEGPDMREKACSLVWVWKTRGHLPHAVEATALITGAILHDDPDRHSVYSIQATYATAFCRFVTALVDKTVHGKKQTMYHLAGEIGIPASFVELRHEATHRDMPSLITLRRAAQRSLEWVWQYYWAAIKDIALEESETRVTGDTVLHQESQFAKDNVQKLVEPIVQRASGPSLSIKDRRVFEQKSLLPIAKSLEIMCQSQGAVLVAQALLEEHILVPQSTSINEAVFLNWEPLLLALCQHQASFLTTLVEEAVKILVSPDPLREKEPSPYYEGIYKWLERILGPSAPWAGMREYLVLPYTQAVCKESNGLFAERLRRLVGDVSASPDIPMDSTDSSGHDNGYRDALSTSNTTEDDADIIALREYGWVMLETRNSTPIGVS